MTISLSEQELNSVVATLKQIKVDGFESMDRLVGLVVFFERKQTAEAAKQASEVKDNGIS